MYFLLQSTPLPPAADQPNSSLDWLVIAMVTIAISYLLLRNTAKRRGRDPLADSAPRMSLAQQRATERAMESLLVELSEMSRQISAQLDTRAAKLEALIREADEKLDQLRAASVAKPPAAPRPAPTAPRPPKQQQPQHQQPVSLLSRKPVPAVAAPEESRPPMRLAVPEPVDPRHAEVYRLADEGLAANQIAQRLSRPAGEIELILALRAH